MTDTDTSAEAVERLAHFHALSAQRYDAEEESGLRACAHMTAATLRALLARAERAEVERDAANITCEAAIKAVTRANEQRDKLRAAVAAARREGIEAALDACLRREHFHIADDYDDENDDLRADGARGCIAAIRALLDGGR